MAFSPPLVGQKFGRLTALKNAERNAKGALVCACVCVCGAEKTVYRSNLLTGKTKSCGCLQKERAGSANRLHGKYGTLQYRLFHQAKHRAKVAGLAFDLVLEDVVIPERCPLLNTDMRAWTAFGPNSPSIDRLNPTAGYTKNNIWVISYRANRIKDNASLAELKMLVANLEDKLRKDGF